MRVNGKDNQEHVYGESVGMPRKFTYADAGVDRKLRIESKESLKILDETFRFSHYGEVVQLPYGNIFALDGDRYLDFVIEGVGTKVLVAQLARKYSTIGIDAVAMAVNDVIRSGARPLAVVDNIHAQVSDPELVQEWLKGVAEGAMEAECIVPAGEIGDVAELINGLEDGKGFDMVLASVGEVQKAKIITGRNVNPGDVVIGFKSSGIHSNGLSLARQVLFKRWGGRYDPQDVPDGLDRELVNEVLEPTKIYVKSLLEAAEMVEVKAAVHITGDAFLKFTRLASFSKGIGFTLDNFKPPFIFELIQKTARELGGHITDEELFKTFNMGWGFAIIVGKKDLDGTLDVIEKTGTQAEKIGYVTGSEGIKIIYGDKRIFLS